ncbi:ATP-dependent helicase [Gulosibacter chungangensis]|uniref:DNA 3'-5' helicase n=1 Tax=Gulosibacter chungangensis TaxID=979746 RepID=A0A7J5BBH4_9MICO|nr:ATP-dependent helicase [Gulosibacter chungangensis]KAB1643464.1 ATP-dependent helicase [Gulosibacter chungangensis]
MADPSTSSSEAVNAGGSEGVSLLADLNPQQREAALSVVGPVCILAGPGTGKTHTITRRIAYGVRTGVYTPERVLALTFTNRAAGELRGRLAKLGAHAVQARTFHAAALRQLGYFWPHVVGGEMPQISGSKSKVVAEAAERLKLRVGPTEVRDIAEDVEWRKISELTYEQYAAALNAGERTPPARLSPEQAVDVIRAYEQVKDDRRVIDFEDILLATAGMLESEPWVTQQVREQYRFFVVDEFQDISPLQHKLLSLWLGQRRDLCVVGDPAQTIYSFTGATNRYLTDFSHEYPDARTVKIEGSYRSTTSIIAVANSLAKQIPHALQLERAAENDVKTSLPELFEYPDEFSEAQGIAQRAADAISAGEQPAEIAVLIRTNAQAAALEQAFQNAQVPYRVAGGQPFFKRPEVRAAVAGLRAAVVAEQDSGPLFKTVSDVLRGRGWTVSPPREAGPARDAWGALDAIMRLADAAAPGTTLEQFTNDLVNRAKHQHEPEVAAVTISTMHGAKGLEWDRVFVTGLAEGRMPIAQAVTAENIHEERRLLYVALTRARRHLQLSYPRAIGAPSRYLAELGNRIQRGNFAATR